MLKVKPKCLQRKKNQIESYSTSAKLHIITNQLLPTMQLKLKFKLRVRFLKKIQDQVGFLNPNETDNGFCASLLNRLVMIRD